MKKLIDRMIADGEIKTFPGLEIVLIQNVADYHFAEQKEQYSFTDYPNVTPPFNKMWFEYVLPRNVWAKDHYGELNCQGQVGVGVTSEQLESGGWRSVYDVVVKGMVNGSPVNHIGFVDIPILSSGTIKDQDQYLFGVRYMDERNSSMELIGQCCYPVMLAISFMHCKNVRVNVVDRPAKVQAQRVKDGKQPLSKYYVLDILPMREVLKREGDITRNGLGKALHICRGHFADYTQGGGLFGKYHGRYWIDSHVRGSVERGVVVKDYNVNAPAGWDK